MPFLSPRVLAGLAASVLVLGHAPAAHATPRDCVTGTLLTASCWNPNGVPTGASSAEIGSISFASAVTATHATGTFAPAYIWIAYSGYNGTVSQSGGTIGSPTNTYIISVGYGAGLTGTYNLSGTGTVNAGNTMEIGANGTGIVNQTSATSSVTVPTNLYIGTNATGNGTYNLSAGTLTVDSSLVSAQESIGYYGTGHFVQTGGTHNANYINMASGGTGSGTYDLSAGSLSSGTVSVRAGYRDIQSQRRQQQPDFLVHDGQWHWHWHVQPVRHWQPDGRLRILRRLGDEHLQPERRNLLRQHPLQFWPGRRHHLQPDRWHPHGSAVHADGHAGRRRGGL